MTKIEWCDEVWNPVTGCSPVSVGCAHCYAKRMAQRLKGRFGYPEDDPFRVTVHWDRVSQNFGSKPKRIFVCSMGDFAHRDVPFRAYRPLFFSMFRQKKHTFMILTKRPHILAEIINGVARHFYQDKWPFPNVYLGISAENQQTADERIPILLQIPAAKRFVSIEPMLGAVDLRYIKTNIDVLWGSERIDWVIIGGLSLPGGKTQAPDPQWIDNIVKQCDNSGIPIFLKENTKYHTKREEFPV